MFFFFKQKTAYEMRISDWSSDVCSSDLPVREGFRGVVRTLRLRDDHRSWHRSRADRRSLGQGEGVLRAARGGQARLSRRGRRRRARLYAVRDRNRQRSEEHPSELQSLMSISYAVFCLKKKIKNRNT